VSQTLPLAAVTQTKHKIGIGAHAICAAHHHTKCSKWTALWDCRTIMSLYVPHWHRRSDGMTSMHSTVLFLSVYIHTHQRPHLKNCKHNAKLIQQNVSLPLQLWWPSAPKRCASTIFSLKIVFRVIENIQRRKWGMWWCSWLRHCATSWKVTGSIPDDVTGIFQWHNPSGRTMALGLNQLSNRNG